MMTYQISITMRRTRTSVERIPRVVVCKTLEEARKSFDELCATNRYTRVEIEQVKTIADWKRDPNWKPAPRKVAS